MDSMDQIKKFEELIDLNYKAELFDNIRKGKQTLVIDFSDISKFDPELAEEILEMPDDSIKSAEIAITHFDLPKDVKVIHIRIKNLPESQVLKISEIRAEHINKLMMLDGIVRQKSDVRPQVTAARFECPPCGNIISVLQLDTKFKEPTKCSCGRKGKFRLLSKELVDAQGIVLEEPPELLEGGEQPKRMNLFLKNDLASPISDKRSNPGSRIVVVGILKEVPIILRQGGQSTRYDLMIEVNYFESLNEDFYDFVISDEEVEQIKEIANDPKCMRRLTKSIAPAVYGHEKIKEALILQLFGGVHKTKTSGNETRGDIHVLLIGDPGSGKSQLLRRISGVSPKGRFVSGKGASAAGLTASVVKDEFLKGWALEAGALVLANNGVCCIDEMDKMTEEDRSAMHEALEQQTVTISKANVQATLLCKTTVLSAANPKFGRFDPYEPIAKQINLPNTLINRFDLIFPVRDLPDVEKDARLAEFILRQQQSPNDDDADIDTELLKKYIAYARKNIFPKLTDEAIKEIKEYFLKMRSSGGSDDGIQAIPISARQLEALVRLAEASAKIRLADKVTKKDAKRGIELVHYCLAQIGVDPETGKIDIDRITTGVTASQRNKVHTIKNIIVELEKKVGKTIMTTDIIEAAAEKGVEESDVEEAIEKLKRSGDIFEPKSGFISKL